MNHSPIQGIAKDSRMPSSLISLRNAVARRSPVQTPTAVFPFLSAIFFYLLWALMFQNGSADMMNEAVATGTLADGQPLRTRFSSIAPIDSLLATLVAFTYPVTSGRDKSSWLLMVDIVSTLQTGMLWAHMENNRVGRKTSWLAYPALIYIAVNVLGAAAVLPLYFLIQLRNQPIDTENWIQLWNASPMTYTFAIGAILPGLAEISATIFPRSNISHQNIIAFMQISPLFMSAVQYIASGLYPIRNIDVRSRKRAYIPSLQRALVVGAIFSAISHAVVLGHLVFGGQSISSIYLPNPTMPYGKQGMEKMLEGSRLFLQFDFIGIALSIMLWCGFIITSLVEVDKLLLAVALVAGIALVGPGAVGCAVLSWREQEMFEQAEKKRQARASQGSREQIKGL